jgi:alpha-glucosidase
MPFLYQGEELGLTDGVVPSERSADPAGTRNANPADSRDGCRTPMPWEPVDGFGFTDADVEPWLPFGGRSADDTVQVQRADSASWLHRYRRLLGVRRRLAVRGPVEWLPLDEAGAVLGYRRGSTMVVANVSDEPVHFDPPSGEWEIAYLTDGEERQLLPARSAAILTERS